MKIKHALLASVLTGFWSYGAYAAVTAQQAAQLGTTLTPFGAIQAGSADGVIPPYTGGITAMTGLPDASSAPGYPDPFASEKPVLTVNAGNMAQYAAELTPGEQALLQRYPSYYMNVYPTHRTMSYPAWVLQGTLKNATTAQLTADGEGITGAHGGIPFPIPQNGYEVMWNNLLSYHPAYCDELFQNYLVDTSGSVTFLGDIDNWHVYPYYDKNATALPGVFYEYYKARFRSPPSINGTMYLFQYPIDFTKSDDVTWFYDPGTRRVRIAPEFKFDTPVASYGGAIDYDEIDMFYGSMSKFDFKLVGEKEIIVPYNDYSFSNTTESEILRPQTLNPADIRWERHRVWVVQATLRPNERHIYSQWDFYVDEDSWDILASESYDHAASIYRVGFLYPYQNYTDGSATTFAQPFGFYDLSKGNYEITRVHTSPGGRYSCSETTQNMSNYTPQAMSAQGIQ